MISKLFAAVLFATLTQASVLHTLRSGCDISKATFSVPANQTAVVAPTTSGPSFSELLHIDVRNALLTPGTIVGLAAGVQNYTCAASTSTYTNVGAVAELIDASCLWSTPLFNPAVDILYDAWKEVPASITTQELISTVGGLPKNSAVLGQHYYVPSPTGTGVSPKWDFTSALFKGNPEAFVIASKTAQTNAPEAATDVAWVCLHIP
jgi:hypothetical protein